MPESKRSFSIDVFPYLIYDQNIEIPKGQQIISEQPIKVENVKFASTFRLSNLNTNQSGIRNIEMTWAICEFDF